MLKNEKITMWGIELTSTEALGASNNCAFDDVSSIQHTEINFSHFSTFGRNILYLSFNFIFRFESVYVPKKNFYHVFKFTLFAFRWNWAKALCIKISLTLVQFNCCFQLIFLTLMFFYLIFKYINLSHVFLFVPGLEQTVAFFNFNFQIHHFSSKF
jgi:hypothetical protein